LAGVGVLIYKDGKFGAPVISNNVDLPADVKNNWRDAVINNDLVKLESLNSKILSHPNVYIAWLKQVADEPKTGENVTNKISEQAALLLARIGTADAVQGLLSSYEKLSTNKSFQDNFRSAIQFITNPESVPVMFDYAVKSKDLALFSVLTQQIGKIANSNQIDDMCKIVMNSSDERQKFIATVSLQEVPPERSAPIVRKYLTDKVSIEFLNSVAGPSLIREGSEANIMAFRNKFVGANDKERQVLLDGIFAISNPKSLPLLEKLALSDPDPRVRETAVFALGNYPIKDAMPVLTRLLNDGRTTTDLKKSITFIMNLLKKQSADTTP
jgi:hypothetical protein